jgi:phosphonate transport system substrate-binding protein
MSETSRPPWRPVAIAVVIATAIALVMHVVRVAAGDRAPVEGTIDFAASGPRQQAPAPPTTPALRFAIAPVVSPETSLRAYQPLVDLVGSRCGRKAQFITRGSYAEIEDLLRQQQCDVALVCTYVYVRGQRAYGLQALAAPVIHGATSYHSVVIVPQGSVATGLADLQGRRLAASDLLSTSGWIWPAQWLREQGRDPATFVVQVLTGSHDRSVLAVVRGQADAAAVDSIVYAEMRARDPAVAAHTAVIQRSPPFGMPPVVCHPQLDPVLRSSIQAALLGLHGDADGRAALGQVGFDRFAPVDDALYEGVRATASAWEDRK